MSFFVFGSSTQSAIITEPGVLSEPRGHSGAHPNTPSSRAALFSFLNLVVTTEVKERRERAQQQERDVSAWLWKDSRACVFSTPIRGPNAGPSRKQREKAVYSSRKLFFFFLISSNFTPSFNWLIFVCLFVCLLILDISPLH